MISFLIKSTLNERKRNQFPMLLAQIISNFDLAVIGEIPCSLSIMVYNIQDHFSNN